MNRELRALLVNAAIEARSSDPATVAAFLIDQRPAELRALLATLAGRVFGQPGAPPAEPAAPPPEGPGRDLF